MIKFFSDNPLQKWDVGGVSSPTFVDLDGDRDLDAVVGNGEGTISYFKNTGNRKKPKFRAMNGKRNPFVDIDVGYDSQPELVDIDRDGDLDAFIGNNGGYYKLF